ncbi:amidohydrolase family protein [Kangiella sediminilitoris]|uniref:Amidohydrolase n=1 Tax=Kangiella sediminilitoris TaxID=1144748 RepID=A0A1B3BAX2_9GAMM|nr:amidohydrolase family protein [Kangiella sediminilitoris]AOE49941.1 Amidohydrolase [Kangiella sediminilitoris]
MRKQITISAIAISVMLAVSGCSDDSESQKTPEQLEQTNNQQQVSNDKADDTQESKAEKNVVEPAVTYNIYNKEDQAGFVEVEQDGNTIKAHMELGWNNRRVNIDETTVVGESGYIISQEIKGISAFGAPIEESFSMKDGSAQWKSLNEQGSAEVDSAKFYIASDGTGISQSLLVKRLLEAEDGKVELLPSGTASLIELETVTLTQGEEEKTVRLLGVVGLGFTPEFGWYDEDNNFFATDSGGWFGVIAKGWGRSNLEKLQKLQKDAENQYLTDLAKKLTHTSEKPILVTNANYVDVESGELVENQSILVEDGKISKIGDIEASDNYTLVDAKGKTVIPGLWDMHGHLTKSNGLLNIPAGVTNVRDMGNTHDNITAIDELSRGGDIIGGDVYRAGFMDRESPYAMKMGKTVSSLEEAKAAVDWYADRGYIQIKTYSSMEPEWVKPLAEHVHSKGLRLSGHIPAFMTAEEAVDAGFDEIQHINMLFLNFLGKGVDTRKRLRFSLVGEKAGELDLDSKEVNDFIAKLKEKGIEVDATVSTFNSLFRKSGVVDPEIAPVYEHLPANVARGYTKPVMDISSEERDAYDASIKAMSAMVKKLHDNGVPVVPGTDAIAGFTLHRELELYADAGISNADVLKLATIGSAKVVGNEENVGSITEGKQADLVFVDGNPLEDMSDLRQIALVIKGQRLYKPDEIYESIGVKPFTSSIDF